NARNALAQPQAIEFSLAMPTMSPLLPSRSLALTAGIMDDDLLVSGIAGVPTAMKPPIIRLALSGIIATDCSREIDCMLMALLRRPAAVDRQRRAPNLCGCFRAKKHTRLSIMQPDCGKITRIE